MALSRVLFVLARKVFDLRLRLAHSYEQRDKIMALYSPVVLILLPAMWVTLVIGGFGAMFWGLDATSLRDALVLSGSSVTTLGFAAPDDGPTSAMAVVEAVIGLGLVALLISYLPSIYASFQRRELQVAMLEVRAGEPPSAVTMIVRHHRIGNLDRSEALFAAFEEWFADIEETHTSHPALVFFRSPVPERSWITAAGAVLDSAALMLSTVDLRRSSPQAQLCLRAGYLSLRRIAGFFTIPFDPDPLPGDPITIDRSEFDRVCEELRAEAIPLKADLDQAWRDFKGWRVNYDQVLVTLAGFVMAPPAMWSSDRSVRFRVAPLGGRFRRAER
ncbi:MAG: hypothetical protein WKF43_14990 [Acidimicrobiales bacterium]